MGVGRFALVLAMLLLAAGAAFAQHPRDKIGVGFAGNSGGGSKGGFFSPGLSFKARPLPVFWGAFAHIHPSRDFTGAGVTGDHYFFERNFVSDALADDDGYTYNLRLDWFAGAGAFANVYFWRGGGAGFAAGVRAPAGVSWRIVRQAELAVGVVPALGFYAGHGGPGFHWAVAGELALRYWFNPAGRGRGRHWREPRENGGRGNGGCEGDYS